MSDKKYPGRGTQKLTAKQEEALAFVTKADDRWREAKLNAQIEVRKLVQERIDMHAATRDQAVYEAIQAGVPKSRISQEGLRTSPNAVYDILERVSQKLAVTNVELATPDRAPYEWSERFTMPNGYNYWFLIVDGDDHVSTIADAQAGFNHEHPGYVYVDFGASGWAWPLGKPSPEAQAWAEGNKPRE